MPGLRRLSGDEPIAVLGRFGFAVHSQRGSHVKLRRVGAGGERQTLTVPRHRELDSGTREPSTGRPVASCRRMNSGLGSSLTN